EGPVQDVEDDVGFGLERADERAHVARQVDGFYLVAGALQRLDAARAGRERNLAFGRPSAHQHGDALLHWRASFAAAGGRPIRRISHSSVTPLLALTRRRTSSPRFSMSAAVAL